MQPGCDPLCLRDPNNGLVGELGQPAPTGDSVLGSESRSPQHEGHIECHTSSVDMLECPVLAPLLERQRARPAIDVAHFLDVPACVGEKALPLFWMRAWV